MRIQLARGLLCVAVGVGVALATLVPASSAIAAEAAPQLSMVGPGLRSTDLARSKKFYTTGLGMTVLRELQFGTVTEVIVGFATPGVQNALLLLKDSAPDKSPPIELGNGFEKIVLRVDDVDALVARLKSAGYKPGEVKTSSVNDMKVVWVSDPDGYQYEIAEMRAAPRS